MRKDNHMTDITIENQEQLSSWVKEQFQRANKYLAEQGILFDSVVTEESRYLAPYFAVWKMKSSEGKYFWVTSGNVSCDAMAFENAPTARDAIKHFSFSWQAKAENIRVHVQPDRQQLAIAERLIKDAELLYEIQLREEVWQEQKA